MNATKRFKPGEFMGDEQVGFAAVDINLLSGPIEEKYWVYISGCLWSRFLYYASDYNQHFGQVVDAVFDTVLGPEECVFFNEELEFVIGIVNEPAFSEALLIVLTEVGKVINQKNLRLVIRLSYKNV